MKNGDPSTTLDDLIHAALTGGRYNHTRLGLEAKRYALTISKAKAGDLADDLHEEVFTQAFLHLFQWGPDILTKRSGKSAFRRAVLAAIRTVRANNAPPGERTRKGKSVVLTHKVSADSVGALAAARSDADEMEDRAADDVDIDGVIDPRADAGLRHFEAEHDVEVVLAFAPPRVAAALRLIHQYDHQVTTVAAGLGLDRRGFGRLVDKTFEHVRAAAA